MDILLVVILTGGASRRMGRDKAALPLDGQTMALSLAEKYKDLGPVCFSVDRRDRFPAGPYGQLIDRYPGRGPLNGIVSAFSEREEDMLLLTATDMPAARPEAALYLRERIGDHEACLFRGQPLFALYRRSCLGSAVECLEAGQPSFRALLERIDALVLPPEDEEMFLNLNTPAEYDAFINRRERS
ncbi:MAG: molybdenum cofactor guanylyltransferase [Oscillospiraceae bacterium]|nr:molybdenum cofactor guanylyltransferase [Oscillospiraceae bacterium]